MLNFHLRITAAQNKNLVKKLKKAVAKGDMREVNRVMAILALGDKKAGSDQDKKNGVGPS